MPRAPLHTDDIRIEQKPDILDDAGDGRAPEIVRADPETMEELAEELGFMDEPVTIRLEPSAEKNAPMLHPVWVNGKGAEVFLNGRWVEMTYLPVGRVLVTKRKYVAVLATAKYDAVTTEHGEPSGSEYLPNNVRRQTTAVTSFSVIEDRNPKGGAWLTELRRRNF